MTTVAPHPGVALGTAAGDPGGWIEVAVQALADLRRTAVGWSIGMTCLATLYVSLWPSLTSAPALTDLFAQLPAGLRTFLSAAGDPSTAAGYVQLELFSLTGPVLTTVLGVSVGSALLAGAEERGQLAELLTAPVSRPGVLAGRAIALSAVLLAPMTCLVTVLLVAGPWAGLDLAVTGVLGAVLHLWLLGVVLGSLALAVGAASGSTAIARGTAAVVGVLGYAVNGMAPLVHWLGPLQRLSPFHDLTAPHALVSGPSWAHAALSAAEVVVLVASGGLLFVRRDVSGP